MTKADSGKSGSAEKNKVAVTSPSDWMFPQPSILDQLHDSVIATDLTGIITGCNRAAEASFGYTADELIGQSVAILYPPEDRDFLLKTLLSTVKATGEFRGEFRNSTRAGESVYVHLSVSLLRDGDDTPAGTVHFSSNITAQKLGDLAVKRSDEVERVLKSSREASANMHMLATAVEHAEDVFLITEAEPIDHPGPRILYVNQKFEKATGYKAEEVLGKTPRILQGPKTDRATLDRIRKALKDRTPVREEMTNYRKDGSEFNIELSLVPIANEDGSSTHWMGIQRDITEQKRLRERLEEDESRLHFLTEAMPQLLWTADQNGMCEFVSESYARFIGVRQADCYGEGWRQFIHPDDIERTSSLWKECVEKKSMYVVEYRLRRHDGQYIWFLHRAAPRVDHSGRVVEWIGSSTDIAQQKRSEEAIRQTEKLAAVGRLASSIAHEINNPLASVTNLLYLLSTQSSLDRTAREYVKSAQEELSRVSEITTQTLRFHKQSTAAAPARISEILDSVLAFNRGKIAASSLHLRREYERTEQLTCFAAEIRQALLNIISNAIEASPQGGSLRVRLHPSVKWKHRHTRGIRVTIGDTGHGIERDALNRIFEPFFTTKGITGTGLGLWITKDLIAKHDGSILVRSSTNPAHRGTVVSIFFPYEPRRRPANSSS